MVAKQAALFIMLIFISSCSTHRVIHFSSCGQDRETVFYQRKDFEVKKSMSSKYLVLGDGIDHPFYIKDLLNKYSYVCEDLSKISIKTIYDWSDALLSLIPFVSRKKVIVYYVMDDEL